MVWLTEWVLQFLRFVLFKAFVVRPFLISLLGQSGSLICLFLRTIRVVLHLVELLYFLIQVVHDVGDEHAPFDIHLLVGVVGGPGLLGFAEGVSVIDTDGF